MKKTAPVQFNIDAAAESAMRLIASATEAAAKTLANAAAEAVKVVAATAAESAKNVEFRRTEDHDLLIRLEEKMVGIKADIHELKEGHASIIADHESRLKKLCEWRSGMEGESGLLSNISKNCKRLTTLEDAKISFEAQVKTWIVIAGIIFGILGFLADNFF